MRIARFVGVWASLFLAVGCGPGQFDSPSEADSTSQATRALGGTRLRLMTGNLTSESGTYNSGSGARIFQGCAPDIAMIQEFKVGDNGAAALRAFVDSTFGTGFSYVRGEAKAIPNGVISRYPIIASGDWDDKDVAERDFTWARIDVPGSADLWVVSVHLLTTSAGARSAEASALLKYIRANVPPTDFVVIGGDFNTKSRTEKAVTTLGDVVVTDGPYPADLKGNTNTNRSRNSPYDWVLVSPALDALEIPTVIGSASFANGFVADTRVFTPIDELAPAKSSDSAASNMQHMGVVRDFQLPDDNGPSNSLTVLAPNGGEQLVAGQSLTVSWRASANVRTVDLSYSSDGVTFTPLASGLDATSGSAQWVVPGPATSSGLIRVTGGGVSDVSDAAFTVTVAPAALHLEAPNGGETFALGAPIVIRWSSTSVDQINLDYAADGANFSTRIFSGFAANRLSFTWQAMVAATTMGRIRVSDASNAAVLDVSDAVFTIAPTPPQPMGFKVIINEVLLNEPGTDVAGEFIELANVGDSEVDLSSYALSDSVQVRHVFAAGTKLAAGAMVVVFGNLKAAPTGITAVGASTGALGLSNGSDSVTLRAADGAIVDAMPMSTQQMPDGVSLNRSPDQTPDAAFALHTSISAATSSPGRAASAN